MNARIVGAVLGSALAAALACASESGPGRGVYGGASGAGPGPGGAAGTGGGGASGVGALGGIGGGIDYDSGTTRDANPDAPCESYREDVKVENLPVDIVWGVDNSFSMVEETVAVQENINVFSQQISAARIDVHVVMLAGYGLGPGLLGICVGAPLGTGQCPADSKMPSFFHHPTAIVDSWNAATVFKNMFPEYRHMLRPSALKYLVIVTDDDSTGFGAGVYADNPTGFIADYTALDPMMQKPGGGPGWKLSGVYAQSQCQNATRIGNFWKTVIDQTGGVHGDICACPPGQQAACTQTFKAVLDSLATTIKTAAKPLGCEYAIPPPPPGKTFDEKKVNVDLTTNGATENIGWVPDVSACHPELGGWYYDDNVSPTRIITCPKSCERIKATTDGNVSVALGCDRKPIPIAK
jgi:hypothetical protein